MYLYFKSKTLLTVQNFDVSDSAKVLENMLETQVFVSRQVNSLFQTEFSKECDLELPPSTSSIFLFP
jgi:hypothetical protein